MPFVTRNEKGEITSVHQEASGPESEELATDNPELLDFVRNQLEIADPEAEFQRLDLEFIRVIEDVIYLLIEKRLIVLTDLPMPAQNKLAERRNFRGRQGDLSGIVSENEEFYLP